MSIRYAFVLVAVSVFVCTGRAQTILWNFGTSVGLASPSADTADFLSGGDVSLGNSSGTMLSTTSASSGYAGASGIYNAAANAHSGVLNTDSGGSSYFEFTLTPSVGYTLTVTNLSFGSRSTLTGPQAFCVRSSLNGYTTDLVAGALTNNSTWALKSGAMAATSTVAGAAVTFRIYGYDGTGTGTGNWRMDDLTVWANAVSATETTPPGLDQVLTQNVRVGKSLSFELTITPTDGDPVTYTNVTASAGVAGAWSLINGFFCYTPADVDFGERAFGFRVADKDGTNTMTVVVNVLRRLTEALPIASGTGAYTQDFDVLAASGSDNEWDNAAYPLEAWYAYANVTPVTSYPSGTGSNTSGGLYSFGASSSDADRSLGSLASSGNIYTYGVAFTNEMGLAVSNLTVSFTAEQWRVGANNATNTLAFDYCVTNRVLPLNEGAWLRIPALCYDSPLVTNEVLSAGAVYVSSPLSSAIPTSVPPESVLLLRWSDPDDTGNDHAFGIDDVAVTWSAETPSPARRTLMWVQ